MGELWSCNETTAKGHHFVAMTKKVASFLGGKIGVTPTLVTPLDNAMV